MHDQSAALAENQAAKMTEFRQKCLSRMTDFCFSFEPMAFRLSLWTAIAFPNFIGSSRDALL